MTKEMVKIKLTKEYKQEAINIIDNTIEYVLNKYNYKLSDQEKSRIKNFTLDQINVNVSQKVKSKTMWIFDTEENIPIIVSKSKNINNIEDYKCSECKLYKINTNLTWTFNEDNCNNGGITHEDFKRKILKMLLEDFETAAFYGTLSYVSDLNESDNNE